MNKKTFINTLEANLNGINYDDKKDIIYDYEEHFRMGKESGKTEEDIATSLGDPKILAKQFKASYMIEKAKTNTSTHNIFSAILAVLALGFFNLIFVLGPFIALAAVLLVLYILAIVVIITGVCVLFASIISPFYGFWESASLPIVGLFASIGTTALGFLFFIGDCYIAKYFYRGTLKYLKWNLNIIKGQEDNKNA